THVLLPVTVLLRRAYAADVIGAAVEAPGGGARAPAGGGRVEGPSAAGRGRVRRLGGRPEPAPGGVVAGAGPPRARVPGAPASVPRGRGRGGVGGGSCWPRSAPRRLR